MIEEQLFESIHLNCIDCPASTGQSLSSSKGRFNRRGVGENTREINPTLRGEEYGGLPPDWQLGKTGRLLAPTLSVIMPRPRRLIVDAYNVLHVTGILAPQNAGPDLEDLARLIAQSRWGSIRTSLICDGAASDGFEGAGRVEVIYAGAGKDADSLIESILKRDSAPRSLRVISTDRRLRKAASRRRAGSMTSEDFVHRLNLDAHRAERGKTPTPAGQTPSLPVCDRDVDRWLDHFGVSVDDPLRRLRAAAGLDASTQTPTGRTGADKQAFSSNPSAAESALPKVNHDPVIEQALDEWRDRLSRDDLDMSKWFPDVIPMRRDDEPTS